MTICVEDVVLRSFFCKNWVKMSPETKKARLSCPLAKGFRRYGAKMSKVFPYSTFIFSPFLTQTALTICYLGAEESTESEMAEVMNYNDEENFLTWFRSVFHAIKREHKILIFGSKMFIKNTFQLNAEYKMTLQKNFPMLEFQSVDFDVEWKCTAAMNMWVDEKTKCKIRECPWQFDGSRIELAASVYLNGEWERQFESTCKKPFWVNSDESIPVLMMIRDSYEKYGELPELDAEVLELNYKNSDIKMMFILPSVRGFAVLENTLAEMNFEEISDRLEETFMHIEIPKIKFRYRAEDSDEWRGRDETGVVKRLGIKEAFDRERADFSGIIDGQEPLHFTDINPRVFIEVGECGTKVAQVSCLRLRGGGGDLFTKSKDFIANRPFVFIIRLGAVPLFQNVIYDDWLITKFSTNHDATEDSVLS